MPELVRDDAVIEEIVARLEATGAFDAVYPSTPTSDDVTARPGLVGVAWAYWVGASEVADEAIGAGGPTYERTVEFQIALHAVAEDHAARLRRFARLDSAARNALLDRSGDPPWRWIDLGRSRVVAAVLPPAMRSLASGTAVYGTDGASTRDETSVEGT